VALNMAWLYYRVAKCEKRKYLNEKAVITYITCMELEGQRFRNSRLQRSQAKDYKKIRVSF